MHLKPLEKKSLKKIHVMDLCVIFCGHENAVDFSSLFPNCSAKQFHLGPLDMLCFLYRKKKKY
jgi:type III secretory pathway component EscU